MVLYDERGAYFAQTLSDVNAVGWPQDQVRIEEEKPKHTLDYHPGNDIFSSPLLASEANVRSQNQNLPSQALQSSINDVSRTYFTGSPEQEPIRYGDYFLISDSQGPSSFTNETQFHPEATQQSITSVRNDLASQDRKVSFTPTADPGSQQLEQLFQEQLYQQRNLTQTQTQVQLDRIKEQELQLNEQNQQQIQQLQQPHHQQQLQELRPLEQLQEQQKSAELVPEDILPFLEDILLHSNSMFKTPSATSSPNMPPNETQTSPQMQSNDQNKDTNSEYNFPQTTTNSSGSKCTVIQTPILAGEWASLLPSSISQEETNLSRSTSRASVTSSNSGESNTPVLNQIESQPNFRNSHEIYPYQNTEFLQHKVSNKLWNVPTDSRPANLRQINHLEEMMKITSDLPVSLAPARGRPRGLKNGVKTTRNAAKCTTVLEYKKQSRDKSLFRDVSPFPGYHQFRYAQPGYLPLIYPQHSPEYPQHLPEYPQHLSEYPQHWPPQHSGYPTLISGSSQLQLPGYTKQISKPDSRQHSRYVSVPEPAHHIPQRMHHPESMQQFPEYPQQLEQQLLQHTHQPPQFPQEILKYARPLLEYAQDSPECRRQISHYADQLSAYNQRLTGHAQDYRGFTQQFLTYVPQMSSQTKQFIGPGQQATALDQQLFLQSQKVPFQNQQFQGQQRPSRSQQAHAQSQQFLVEDQQVLQRQQAPFQNQRMPVQCQQFQSQEFPNQNQPFSGRLQYLLEGKHLPQNAEPHHLRSPLQRISSPSEPSSPVISSDHMEYLPKICHKFLSTSPNHQKQETPENTTEVSNEPTSATPFFRSWHIPEVLPVSENSTESEHVQSSLVQQTEAKTSEETSMKIQKNSMDEVSDSKEITVLPSLGDINAVSWIPTMSMDTASQMCDFEEELQTIGLESNVLPERNEARQANESQKTNELRETHQLEQTKQLQVPEVSRKPSSFVVPISGGIATVTPVLSSVQKSRPVPNFPTRFATAEWLLKSPPRLVIDTPADTRKRKRENLRWHYKPRKGLRASIKRYRARGIATRSPPPEVYLKEAARSEDIDDEDDDDEEDEDDYHQDAVNNNKMAVSNQDAKKAAMQKDTVKSKDPALSREENDHSSKLVGDPSGKFFPTAHEIVDKNSKELKKSKIHHRGLPNLQGLLPKPDHRK